MKKIRNYTQILSINIRSKDIYHRRPLLTANDFIYDSIGRGKPIYISSQVMKNAKLPLEVPLYYGHQDKRLVLGKVRELSYDFALKSIVGNIEVSPRWQTFVLDKIREGVNGISVEFASLEDSGEHFNRVIDFNLLCACIVDKPANHPSRI